MAEQSPFERFGGHGFFSDLVTGFYEQVSTDPVLRPLYPEADLGPAAQRLLMFLEQYWGGPTTYSQLRGHPRLRMRHAPFRVDAAAHDAWLAAMSNSLERAAPAHGMAPEDRAELWDYLTRAAFAMVNTFPTDPHGSVLPATETPGSIRMTGAEPN
jgi:hemoglobin